MGVVEGFYVVLSGYAGIIKGVLVGYYRGLTLDS
jgi:hypothetical protein